MATSSNVSIREWSEIDVIKMPVGSSTVLAYGDLIDSSGGSAVAHSGDNSTFVGVAIDGSESGSVAEIAVATKAKISIKLSSSYGNAVLGNACKYVAGANGTDWQVASATTEGIIWALESITAGNSGLFLVDSHSLTGGFLFQTCVEG